jgi:hypothetical protein
VRHIEWPGVVAVILAVGIAVSMVLGVAGTILSDVPLSEQGAQFLSTLFGASIGAVATYLGMAQRAREAERRTRRSDDDVQGKEGGTVP